MRSAPSLRAARTPRKSHRAVSNNGNRRAFADARGNGRVVPGPHYVGEGQYGLQHAASFSMLWGKTTKLESA